MKPYEFKRFYHPKLGKFVYKHKGSGLIVDNIFKPMKSVVSSVIKKFVKGELRGKIKGILYVWPRVYVSIFDSIIPISFH